MKKLPIFCGLNTCFCIWANFSLEFLMFWESIRRPFASSGIPVAVGRAPVVVVDLAVQGLVAGSIVDGWRTHRCTPLKKKDDSRLRTQNYFFMVQGFHVLLFQEPPWPWLLGFRLQIQHPWSEPTLPGDWLFLFVTFSKFVLLSVMVIILIILHF